MRKRQPIRLPFLLGLSRRVATQGSGGRAPVETVLPEHKKTTANRCRFFRAPSGSRTLDPNIKSVVLYQLS